MVQKMQKNENKQIRRRWWKITA